MHHLKKAFTFVELIISISIIVLLAVIGITAFNGTSQKTSNAKVESDITTLKNAFLGYHQENATFPQPNGNNNYFTGDSSYAHSGSADSFGVYGSVTEDTLPKKYLDIVPLDPISNHYYSYGKTLNNKYFELAGVLRNDEISSTKMDGTYPGEYGPISLIREYNGGFFVSDRNTAHLPYNPDEHIFTVTDDNGNIHRVGDTIQTTTGETKNLYFSDGSVSTLQEDSTLTLSELDFKTSENNLTTKVKLFLSAGSIFTKATALNDNSDFEIYTSDTAAAVRGTIFKMDSDGNVVVYEGKVAVYQVQSSIDDLAELGYPIYTIEGNNQDYSNFDGTDEIIEDNLPIGKPWVAEILNPTEPIEPIEPTEPESCEIGDLEGTIVDSKCIYRENALIPGTPGVEKSVDLEGEFEIEMVVESVPQTTQYLLYGGDNFKLFFGNGEIGNKGEICFQKGGIPVDLHGCKTIIDKKITIKRDSYNRIYLNGDNTTKIVDGEIEEIKLGYLPGPGDVQLLKMNFQIDIIITK